MGFLGVGGVLALTLGSLVKALDGRGRRTRTRRNDLIPSERWPLVCYLRSLLILARTAAGHAGAV